MEKKLSPTERDAEMTSSKATKAEFAKDYDQAFRLYLKSAEYFLHLSRSTSTTDKIKQQWKANAGKCLARAEKIKKFVDSARVQKSVSVQPAESNVRLTPVGIDHFSPQEQYYVLKKGSQVNNHFYQMWDDSASTKHLSTSLYTDPDGQPMLSPEQEKVSPVWRRPPLEIPRSSSAPTRRKILPQQILQHVVTDCSVCASISVCLEHGRRFDSTLEKTIRSSFESASCAAGRYDVRVFFNGTWRRVLIDDQLPFHPTEGKLMCMSVLPSPSVSEGTSMSPLDTLWPILLEKAYMKLMGGYDFPGSNSSIDLHALAGWIPEHIDLQGSTFEREKTWERIERGFASGSCVVTLGTGPTLDARWRNTPLLSSHSYAVIDVYETSVEGRILSVLDSWVSPGEGYGESTRELQIPWAEVLTTFSGVYLSWDPRLWQNALNFHSIWKRNTEDDEGTQHVQIEFNRTGTADEEVWILLTRHVVNTQTTSDFCSLRVDVEDDLISATTIADNQRMLSSKGTYTNNTHILVRKRIPSSQRSGILSISASYDGDAREIGFTLSAYAGQGTSMSWIDNKTSHPPYTHTIDGSFTSKTAGGNCTYPTFMINPQYEMIVHSHGQLGNKAKVSLNLQTSRDIPVNVAVVWSQNQRVTELPTKDLVATSGAYNYGSARITKNINVGSYVLIASAFEPQHIGPYILKVDSSHPFDMKPIPQEGAGMYCKVVRGAWDKETAGGRPSSSKYTQNPKFEVILPSGTQLKIRLHSLQSCGAIALNVTVYPDYMGDVKASLKTTHVATSGSYDDSLAGVATPQVSLGAGRYYIVPSTYNAGTTAAFRMLVYSSASNIQVNELAKS